MKLDDAIYEVLRVCRDDFSAYKMCDMLYYKLFNSWPYYHYVVDNIDIYDDSRPYNTNPWDDDESCNIDVESFHEYITKIGFVRVEFDYETVYVNTDDMVIVHLRGDDIRAISNVQIDNDYLKSLQRMIDEVVIEEDKVEVGILVSRNGSFYVDDTEIDRMNIDVDKTYNDDIPLDSIDNFIKNDKNGLALFYGEPGTGKSTFIRHLIQKHADIKFVILDANLLYNITSHSLLNTFVTNPNAVYIIEDCEKLLVSRENEPNPIISAFLNMTDGILANVINCKFICTFNTDLNNIDTALTRKGRMKLKYEFKKLSADKVARILDDDNVKDMSIADVMYIDKKNDYSEKNIRRIGF